MSIQSSALHGYDREGVRRVAGVLLRHIKPRTVEEARLVLKSRLGVYPVDAAAIKAEIDQYFRENRPLH